MLLATATKAILTAINAVYLQGGPKTVRY